MASRTFIVSLPNGLHARPAQLVAQAAMAHTNAVNFCKGKKSANAKSILGLLTLGAKCGDHVTIQIEGDSQCRALDREVGPTVPGEPSRKTRVTAGSHPHAG